MKTDHRRTEGERRYTTLRTRPSVSDPSPVQRVISSSQRLPAPFSSSQQRLSESQHRLSAGPSAFQQLTAAFSDSQQLRTPFSVSQLLSASLSRSQRLPMPFSSSRWLQATQKCISNSWRLRDAATQCVLTAQRLRDAAHAERRREDVGGRTRRSPPSPLSRGTAAALGRLP